MEPISTWWVLLVTVMLFNPQHPTGVDADTPLVMGFSQDATTCALVAEQRKREYGAQLEAVPEVAAYSFECVPVHVIKGKQQPLKDNEKRT